MDRVFVLALLLLAATHFLVDTFACVLQPLWPAMETRLDLQSGSVMWLFLIWSLSTSLGQMAFGLAADRYRFHWILWASPVISLVLISCIGLSTSPIVVGGLLLSSGLAVAAFHPEAAATAGNYLPEHRSRAMSVFALGGYLGQSTGPLYGGMVTDRFGFSGLAWGILWGLTALLAISVAMRRIKHRVNEHLPEPVPTAESHTGKLRPVVLLVCAGVLRVTAAIGVPLALAFVLDARGATKTEIGFLQSSFLLGIGTGALICGVFMQPRYEQRALCLLPFGVAALLAMLPATSGVVLVFTVALAGTFIGITLPVLISYGQRLLPDRQRVASALTMGVTWGIGSTLVTGLIWCLRQTNRMDIVFTCYSIAVLFSGLLCFFLPQSTAGRDSGH